MDKKFDRAFKKVLKLEGGYSNDPNDYGGKTKYGISERMAKDLGYNGEIKDLSKEQAKEIYYNHYWKNLNYDQLKDEKLYIECFEQAVNLGARRANLHLQRAYNLLAKEELVTDGIVGSKTLYKVNNCNHIDYLLKLLNIMQGVEYIRIAEQDKSQKKFIRGWLRRVRV